jgi:hypothetical protein
MKENSSIEQFNEQKETDEFVNYFDKIIEVSNDIQDGTIRIDFNTAYQAIIAEYIVRKIRDDVKNILGDKFDKKSFMLLDSGSKFSEVLSFSKYFQTVFTECRNGVEHGKIFEIPGLDMSVLNCEAQMLDKVINAKSINVVTSLHALEHFGLGRYGDTIDYFGDQKGLAMFNKILKQGGNLVLSVPFSIHDSPRIEFNNQRVYNYKTIDKMLESSGFQKLDQWFILPLGSLRTDDDENEAPIIKDNRYIDGVKESKTTRESTGVYLTVSKKIKDL